MGLIRASVRNPVAANMLMILILGGGFLGAWFIPRELFPEFSVDYITVSVPYLGASPEDVQDGICLKIEERMTGLEGIEEISSSSQEGFGTVNLKIATDADVRKVLDDVKSEVDKIDFPLDAEDPTTVEITLRRHVIHVAVAGPEGTGEHTLKEIAEDIRDELSEMPEISQVAVSGVRNYEIAVEVAEARLRRFGLTLAQIAQAIRDSSFDLPAGRIRTRSGEMSIRIVGERKRAKEFRDIPVVSRPDGTVVTLAQVATVRETFEDIDIGGQFGGKPAALVSVFKTGDEDTLTIAKAVRDYVERKRKELPEGIVIEPWADMSKLIQDRLDLLVRNGLWGLALVFLMLLIFLGVRLSFWVAMGIPVSVFGALLVMNLTGQTLNMMSMFALIMALGLIVDDAIVVGENIYARVERGAGPHTAALRGTMQVLLPVIGAVVTTFLAFMPLLFIPGVMGRFIEIIPYAVVLALSFSLVECLIILPPHLAHSLEHRADRDKPAGPIARMARRTRQRIDAVVFGFIDHVYLPVFRTASRYRYVTLAVMLAIPAVMGGAYKAGFIKFVAFPKVDSDTIVARVTMPTGTPMARTEEVCRAISKAALALNDKYAKDADHPLVLRVYSLLGQHSQDATGSRGAHLGEVIVELQPSEERGKDLTSETLVTHWRKQTGPIRDALALTFTTLQGGPGGRAIEIRLLGPSTDAIKPAARELKTRLAEEPGLTDIQDDALPGKMEIRVRLKEGAEALGIDLRRLAVQLRGAFYGDESLKLQRGRDEIKVMVRYPDSQRESFGHIEDMRVRTAAGDEVPFLEVADVTRRQGYTTLRRFEQDSAVAVWADADLDVANPDRILQELKDEKFFEKLKEKYPTLEVNLEGQRKQTMESLDALTTWFPLALLGIYTILAGIFKSYIQPVIIMVAIPFGLIGAILGHWVVGYDVTLLSMFGMVALAGIVVNDSLVLIDMVNQQVRTGQPVHQAVAAACRGRFRPIFLTTATTVVGMMPLLAEQSFQAQFLKPMAVAIAGGLTFATILTLIFVPCLYLIGNDLRRTLCYLRTGHWPAPEDVVPRPIDLDAEPDADE